MLNVIKYYKSSLIYKCEVILMKFFKIIFRKIEYLGGVYEY